MSNCPDAEDAEEDNISLREALPGLIFALLMVCPLLIGIGWLIVNLIRGA